MKRSNLAASRRIGRGGIRAALVALVVSAVGSQAPAEPITTIFVNDVGSATASLNYDPDGGAGLDGLLSIEIDSLTIIVERMIGGETVPDFVVDASFSFSAEGLTDTSAGLLAAGSFSTAEFELRDGDDNLLLGASNDDSAGIFYGETMTPGAMLLSGGSLFVDGGSLAPDFDVLASLFGLGVFISPDPLGFATLDSAHSGSTQLNLFPIPEPATFALASLGFLTLIQARRVGRRKLHDQSR
jgi:hypothetical protein